MPPSINQRRVTQTKQTLTKNNQVLLSLHMMAVRIRLVVLILMPALCCALTLLPGGQPELGLNWNRQQPAWRSRTSTRRTSSSCSPGPRGPKGSRGADGYPGPPGPRGYDGLRGYQGAKGEVGDPGARGPPGLPGTECVGRDSTPCVPGKNGAPGPRGLPGKNGLPGGRGDKGMQGFPGVKGDAGVPGIIGAQGPVGLPGVPGNDGYQGIKGDPGYQGKDGVPGAKGDAGVPGKHGPPGPVPTLKCIQVKTSGNKASCPAGYKVTGCTCGMNCGVWDIQEDFTQCICDQSCNSGKPLDWTKAVCCKLSAVETGTINGHK